jgi:CRP/FNR family transcriptional regulator, anaerobic regulatory protein
MSTCEICKNCSVRDHSICSVLSPPQLKALGAISRRKFVAAGQHIFREGSECQSYAIIISGAVKLTKTHVSGRQSIIGLLFASDFAGRIFSTEHTYSAEAATDTSLCMFPREGFMRLLDSAPDLERKLFEATANQLSSSHDWAMLLRQPQAVQRVAGFLHFIAMRTSVNTGSTNGSTRFQLPLARREIADFLGVTKETVSRQMTVMKELEVIGLPSRRDVVVRNLGTLAALAATGTGGEDTCAGRGMAAFGAGAVQPCH